MDINEIKRRVHSKELYFESREFLDEQKECLELLYDFNNTRPSEGEKRQELLKKMLGSMGKGCYIEPPFRSNWGGRNVHFGDYVYANFNLTTVDDTHIYVGDGTLFGPNVTIATAGHPIDPTIRATGCQFGIPVTIGKSCWIGAGSIILPGVTIGDGTVIGAGSVVTRDIPSNVVAVGNPCRVLRPIGERDKEYYFKDLKIPEELK